jgi:hypothetical protein
METTVAPFTGQPKRGPAAVEPLRLEVTSPRFESEVLEDRPCRATFLEFRHLTQVEVEEPTAMAQGLLVVLASEAVEEVSQTHEQMEPPIRVQVVVVVTLNPAVTVDQVQ